MRLDDKGRCPNCLRKPLEYRRERVLFCHTCCRLFEMATGEWIANWAWKHGKCGLEAAYPTHDYALATPSPAARRRAGRVVA